MQRTVTLLAATLIISMHGVAFAASDAIVAVVNEDVVTDQDVLEALGPTLRQIRLIYSGEELANEIRKARRHAIQTLVDRLLCLQEARRQEMTVNDRELEERIGDIRSTFASPEAFDQVLKKRGLDLHEFEERQREEMLIDRVVRRHVRTRIAPSPTDIAEHYEVHSDDFVRPEQFRVRQVMVRPRRDRNQNACAVLMTELRNRILNGEDFEAIARAYSDGPRAADGGDLGYVKLGALLPELDAAVASLDVGELSLIIRSDLGFHLIEIVDATTPVQQSFEDVQQEIENMLKRDNYQRRYKEWIEELKEYAFVSIREPDIQEAAVVSGE